MYTVLENSDNEDLLEKSCEETKSKTVDLEKEKDGTGPSESATRRMAHLAKQSEQIGGFSKKNVWLCIEQMWLRKYQP